jgi:hypothetical protein
MYFWIVRLQTWIPSLSNSPRIRSAPHSRLSLAISADLGHSCFRNLRLRRTGSGLVFPKQARIPGDASAGASQAEQSTALVSRSLPALARSTKSSRSVLKKVGRFTWRRRMMSCCRRSAFSATSSDLLLARSVTAPNRKEVVAGFVQFIKRWWSDRKLMLVKHLIKARIPCTVYVTPFEDKQMNAF